MTSSQLTISGLSASGLGKSSPDDDVSKHNPYIEFQVGSEKHKTKSTKKAGAEVSWEGESFQFNSKAGDIVTVSVWHKRHLLSDVAIGKGTITLAELGENGPAEIKLTEPKTGSPAGVLKFNISGNSNRANPPHVTIKGSAGENPTGQSSSPSGTAGFVGTGAEAHDEAGVKTGRAYPKDTPAATGKEAAAVGAGAAAAASAGAAVSGAGDHSANAQPSAPTAPTGSTPQTYTESAKEKAASAADYTAQKLQDLKVGLVGEEGAARAEGKTTAAGAEAPAPGYVDRAKEGAAYLITKTQDALAYTKDRVVGPGPASTSETKAAAPPTEGAASASEHATA